MRKKLLRSILAAMMAVSMLPATALAMGEDPTGADQATNQAAQGGTDELGAMEISERIMLAPESTLGSDTVTVEDVVLDDEALAEGFSEDANEADEVIDEDAITENISLVENSWRYVDGELIDPDAVNTDSPSDGASAASVVTDANGNKMFNTFDTFSGGNCSGIGAGRGIDVSSWQGKIDWAKVKKAGVDFALIRCGVGGWTNGSTDNYFRTNAWGCWNQGIPFGVYVYSKAKTKADARNEADRVVNLLASEGFNASMLGLPVYIDLEDNAIASADLVGIANEFCNKVKTNGYQAGVYANVGWWKEKLSGLSATDVNRWVASWNTTGLNYPFRDSKDVWQFSSRGRVSGISGNVDLNYSYIPTVTHLDYEKYKLVYDWNWYNANVNHDARTEREAFAYFVNQGMKNGEQGSALFDPSDYMTYYADVRNAFGSNMPAYYTHFMNHGAKEGRTGSDDFSLTSYYNAYPDLRAAFGLNPLKYYEHYARYGYNESRLATGVSTIQGQISKSGKVDYSPVYNLQYYLAKNGDVERAYTKKFGTAGLTVVDDAAVLNHFIKYGMKEGRASSPTFDYLSYYNANPDVRAAYGTNIASYFTHYINYGQREGRTCTGVSGLLGSVSKYNGKNYSAVYDSSYYIANNPDVARAYSKKFGKYTVVDEKKVIAHFVKYGMKEGRDSSPYFNWESYRDAPGNGDLIAAFGNNKAAYYKHYMNYGQREHRALA